VIPEHIRPFFWDINADHFDPASYPDYTIARILEYGDQKAVSWLKGAFSDTEIKQVIRTERRLSRKSANFWAVIYGIPRNEVMALTAG
jgi:hypothetical protein